MEGRRRSSAAPDRLPAVKFRRHSGAGRRRRTRNPAAHSAPASEFRVRALRARPGMTADSGRDRMHVLITGAAGMIGRKLTERLVTDRGLCGQPVEKLTLIDIVAPARPPGFSDHVKTRAARPRRAGRRREGDLGAARGDLPSRRRRLRRSRARFRQGLPRQSRRRAQSARGDPQGRRRLQAARWCSPRRWRCTARPSRTPFPTSST